MCYCKLEPFEFDHNYAGEYQGTRLGLYHLTTDTRVERLRQGLVYRQLHIGDNQKQYYLYRWEMRLHCTLHIALLTLDKVRAAYYMTIANSH